MIPFNIPPVAGAEFAYLQKAIESGKLCGDGFFTKKCEEALGVLTGSRFVSLTTSCTHALEMSAMLCGIGQGDEVIMPSYTFVSTANAFVLRGARIVFVDIRPDTMNMDEALIEQAITEKTRAIIPVHYAGVGCEMDKIIQLAKEKDLLVVEDAAQGVMASYKGKPLGTIGNFGCFSFHETKNYTMGEGGAILIRDEKDVGPAEIIREKGTDRSRFLRGQTDKYTWVSVGSSYLPSELNAAYLLAQLERAEEINRKRLVCWNFYDELLRPLAERERISLPVIPHNCMHNAHMFYIKVRDIEERTALIHWLREKGISCAFHYVPLHSSGAGKRFGTFCGKDRFTTRESERLLRLPMFYQLSKKEIVYICEQIFKFYHC